MSTQFNEREFETFIRFPPGAAAYLGRKPAVAQDASGTWAAIQAGYGSDYAILVRHVTPDGNRTARIACAGYCHQPTFVPRADDGLSLAWNEYADGQWGLAMADVGAADAAAEPRTVLQHPALVLPPSGALHQGIQHLAWAGETAEGIRIHVAQRDGDHLLREHAISTPGLDASRPRFDTTDEGLFLVWDEYVQGRYVIGYASFDGDAWSPPKRLGCEGERWLCPAAAARPGGRTYATWLVLRAVDSDSGVRDHAPFAMVAELRDGTLVPLPDAANAEDPRVVADLREGLLAVELYKGYMGLRRNPMLAFQDDRLWCLWEVRVESTQKASSGILVGRALGADGTWTEPRQIAAQGYSFALGTEAPDGALPVAHLEFLQQGDERLQAGHVDLTAGEPWIIDTARWSRWQPARSAGCTGRAAATTRLPTRKIQAGDCAYRMFWADTHCHGNFSPDAEGEPDEIIHYARDVAGIDAVCVIDNDYYPHKALTHAEWQTHQELARHFTEEGRFVVFPGYEYTFHRPDLTPDFNHRCVIYPRPGGTLIRRIDAAGTVDRNLLTTLKRQANGPMVYPHHCTYELLDADLEWNVEICSSWRVCMAESDFTTRQLQAGHRFGFIGSSDSHRACPGMGGALTGVYATELTPEAMFEAYRSRRTVATQGFRIHVDFRVAGAFIGGETTSTSPPAIELTVAAPDTIESVEITRDGEVIAREEPGEAEFGLRMDDRDVAPGTHFYFARIRLVGDPGYNTDPAENFKGPFKSTGPYPHNLARARGVFAWTSPIWVTLA